MVPKSHDTHLQQQRANYTKCLILDSGGMKAVLPNTIDQQAERFIHTGITIPLLDMLSRMSFSA